MFSLNDGVTNQVANSDFLKRIKEQMHKVKSKNGPRKLKRMQTLSQNNQEIINKAVQDTFVSSGLKAQGYKINNVTPENATSMAEELIKKIAHSKSRKVPTSGKPGSSTTFDPEKYKKYLNL